MSISPNKQIKTALLVLMLPKCCLGAWKGKSVLFIYRQCLSAYGTKQ